MKRLKRLILLVISVLAMSWVVSGTQRPSAQHSSVQHSSAQQSSPPLSNVPPLPESLPKTGTIHTVTFIAGSKAGDELTWTTPDGRQHAFMQYNDRGRGPKIDATYAMNEKGWPTSVTLSGLAYWKTHLSEQFTFDGQTASWTTGEGHGSAPGLAGFYLGSVTPSEALAMRVRAARNNGGTLPLLPSGELHVAKLRTESVTINAARLQVTLYSTLRPPSTTPSYVWLDTDDHFFFGGPSSWFEQVRAGAESEMPRLLAIQDSLNNARSAERAHRLIQTPGRELLIRDVALFDAMTAAVIPHQSVLISGNQIVEVGPVASVRAASVQAASVYAPLVHAGLTTQTIDGQGLTLLPGLWDMHVHVGPVHGMLELAAGVTTVRDLGNDVDELLARRARIDAGTEIGPRIIPTGFLEGHGATQGPTKALVDTPEEARAWIAKYHRLGYPQIKIYNLVNPALVPVIVEESHKRGMRVSGHVPSGMVVADVVRAGFDEVQHINHMLLDAMPDLKDLFGFERFTRTANRSADIDIKSPQVQALISLLVEHHTVVDPTLVAFEGILDGGDNEATRQLNKRTLENWKRMTKELYDHGITLDVGTDTNPPGISFQRELELLTESGIPPAKVLQLATIASARTMKRDARLGSIAAGKLADLVLVEGDPTVNINAVRHVRLTIRDGKLYDPAALYKESGMKPPQ